jgi:branched-chain amino acid transport system substrate-binding protein
VQRFFNDFKKKYGVTLQLHYPTRGYDEATAVVEAIKRAGSTDGQKIADAIRRMQYNGIRFTAQWDAKGNIKHTPIPAVVWAAGGTQLNSLTCDIEPVARKKKR